jgi:hypothetical protein
MKIIIFRASKLGAVIFMGRRIQGGKGGAIVPPPPYFVRSISPILIKGAEHTPSDFQNFQRPSLSVHLGNSKVIDYCSPLASSYLSCVYTTYTH